MEPLKKIELIKQKSFIPENHFYTRVLNATIHPLVAFFIRMDIERLIARFCHLNPQVEKKVLQEILSYQPKFLFWAGGDVFNTTTSSGSKKMVLIETNSSPSGQKSMPLFVEHKEHGGYRFLLENSFKNALDRGRNKDGELAVFYDKNYMEASGYASTLAEIFKRDVYLVPWFNDEDNSHIKIENRYIYVQDESNEWVKIKGALRYVTQKPWNRIPVNLKTFVMNPVLACLAGGRNKMVASMAYDLYNGELAGSGLSINVPETIRDLSKNEVPLLVKKFGGHAVIKIPYSNAGQGVYTITSQKELDSFMELDFPYDKFIVQSLIGNYTWSSEGALGKYYHVGTVPDRDSKIYVADLRMMIGSTISGYRPVAVYGRKAQLPIPDKLLSDINSWEVLGTNLSLKIEKNKWESDTSRLLLMDRKDFNKIGVGLDELIHAFIQTVLGAIAIDKMAMNLITTKGVFRKRLFSSINPDKAFLSEIVE